jgi:HD-GYP domain-containing protein (c-di-GMP phosphodiesterase class II)
MKILVWGQARDLFAGGMPAGLAVREVGCFADVRREADERGTLVLAEPAAFLREAAALREWLAGEGATTAATVAVLREGDDADALLAGHGYLHDVVFAPVTAARLRLRLERALEALHGRRLLRQLDAALTRKSRELHEVNKIGVALSAERDIDALLALILGKCREITAADAGSLYLVERGKDDDSARDDKLRFRLAQNDTVVVPFEEFVMPLDQTSIAGYVALTGEIVNVADAYRLLPGTPYTISISFDRQSGYRTKSMLVAPMRDHRGEVLGVVQLINKKSDPHAVLSPPAVAETQVVPFTSVDEELVSSLASQAAVALENTTLIQGVKDLFKSFVDAAVTAIEARDPTTSGHSGRVAKLTVGLAEMVDRCEQGRLRAVRFNRDQLEEIRYASLLHDFGKVGVREKVLIKGKKLYVGEVLLIRQRFAYIQRSLEAEHLRAKLAQIASGDARPDLIAQLDRAHAERQAEIDAMLQVVLEANEPALLDEGSLRALEELPARHFVDPDGRLQPFLTAEELEALRITRGSLSRTERLQIESHVTHTYNFLSQIPWTGEYRRIPEIAYAHHEKLDGTGYPRRLKAEAIPVQSRMMTIADIYDALVAWDRPYKKAVAPERALDILREECQAGKLDDELLALFIGARVWEKTLAPAGAAAR